MIDGSHHGEGASAGVNASEKRAPTVRTLDEALFRAWQSGDLEAREAAWTLLWSALYSMAVGFCHRFCRDHATAEEWASSAIADASVEIERHVAGGASAWPGQGQFVAWVSAHVIFRCRDQCRGSLRWLKRIVDVHKPGDDECDGLDCLDSCPAMQEEDLIRRERDRNGLRRVVRQLAALRELCRDSPSLVAVVDKMQTYLRECLIESLSPEVEATSFTLDELAEAARPESVEATKSALYQLIRQRLDIDRNTLYQRMKRIHALLRGPASLDDDRHDCAQCCSAVVGHDCCRKAYSSL